MEKHTPGPWAVRPATCDGTVKERMEAPFTIGSADGRLVAALGFQGTQSYHNAHLISAAPDLLKACEAAIVYMKHYVATHGAGPDRALAAMESAITKSRGEV